MTTKTKRKEDRKITGWLAILMMVTMGATGYRAWQSGNFENGIAVLGVLDGDTLVLEGKTRFRLRNIDAPEIDKCGGAEAKRELEKLLKDERVRVREEIIDKWGRPMGLIYTGRTLINEEMIKSGWVIYHADKTSVADELKKISDGNKANNRGVFGKCWQEENRASPKCNIKGNIDPSNSSLKRYFVPGCVQYNTTIVELNRGEE